MSTVWDARTYDSERRRLVPCFDEFYGAVAELVARFCPNSPRILELGAGTGLLSSAVLKRIGNAELTLLDASAEMLGKAEERLLAAKPKLLRATLTEELPAGPFDAVISALAIHHLNDAEKQNLFARILAALGPKGICINAEQVSGASRRLQDLFEATHLDSARALGSSKAEIKRAVDRMKIDQCATVANHLSWLEEAGFVDVECFFRWFRFAVFGGWTPG